MDLSTARDLAIVFLAIEAFIVTLLMAIAVVMLWRLLHLIRQEIGPVLASLQETVHTVKGTTTFVSDSFVFPLIRLSSMASGMGGALKALFFSSKHKEG